MTRLAVLVPVLARPHRVKPFLDACLAATPNCEVFLIADPDDREEIEAIEADGRGKLLIRGGSYAEKINLGVLYTGHPLVFLGADDLEFQPGWLAAAKRHLRPGVGVVGVNDLMRRTRDHQTHFLLTRQYATRPTIDGGPGPCHTGYAHVKVDDELLATAKVRGAYAYAANAHVRHLHHLNRLAPDDDTYRRGRRRIRQDVRLFDSRRGLWENPAAQFTIGVASFGTEAWRELAVQRAVPSAEAQGSPVIHVHGTGTLAEARNEVIARTATEFLVLLDADDELADGYIEAMTQGSADVRAPRVQLIRNGRASGGPFMPQIGDRAHRRHACTAECLPYGNWIVIGAAARTALVREVGGFQEEPLYEDWSLWGRCYRRGATFESIEAAVYRQHLRRDSRNHAGPAYDQRARWHQRIGHSIWPEIYSEPEEAAA